MNFPKPLLNKIKNAPVQPGCYIFRDAKNKVLYIGKAVNIRNRVNSYFTKYDQIDPKITIMIDLIRDVEFVTTDSELEALILETNLIKKYKPKYNRMMKDDKNYAWLVITKGDDFPRLKFVREKKLKKHDYFGPYVNLKAIKRALKQLRAIFAYASCNRKIYLYKDKDGKTKLYSSDRKPCLYYHLKLCDAPCAGFTSRNEYRKNINNIKRFFRSRKFEIIHELTSQMNKASESKKFERAADIRDKLEDLKYIAQRIRIEKDMDEKLWKEKKEEARITGLKNLIKKLKVKNLEQTLVQSSVSEPQLKRSFRIECYDISNISGKSATGSMVVFTDGKADKSNYRKFKIKTKDEADDYQMLKEVFARRFRRKNGKDKSFKNTPDLIIVDGGKGQLSSVLKILSEYKLKIPTIGLAKKEEEIIKLKTESQKPKARGPRLKATGSRLKGTGKTYGLKPSASSTHSRRNFQVTRLPRGSNELFLIQQIRDEAHRFAIKYHKILRSKKQVKSVLDDIPGVGEVVRKRLLKAFGSAEGIKKAAIEELQSVVKNKRTVENLKKLL